jgi:hypothetical protein
VIAGFNIEALNAAFEHLPLASDRCWHVYEVICGRLYLSRGEMGEHAVFLAGARDSFGTLPVGTGIDHRDDVVALPEQSSQPMLRLSSADPLHGRRIMAHIGYEIASRLTADPTTTNRALLSNVHWMLILLADADREPLSRERQQGLLGECLFLRLLLLRSHALGLSPLDAIHRWHGHLPAKRDFAAHGVAVEVKTTGASTRQHEIGGLDQLEPHAEGEDVYVFSLGMRGDMSAPRKLPVFIDDVMALLNDPAGEPDEAARAAFLERLVRYGYDPTYRARYEGEPGFLVAHLPGALFHERELGRLRRESFVAGQPPETVLSLRYVLEIRAEPISEGLTEEVLTRLLLSPALGT